MCLSIPLYGFWNIGVRVDADMVEFLSIPLYGFTRGHFCTQEAGCEAFNSIVWIHRLSIFWQLGYVKEEIFQFHCMDSEVKR